MFQSMSQYLTSYFIQRGVVPQEQHEIYEYGFELTISQVFADGFIFLLSLLYRRPADGILFLLCTIPLRRYGGGWHASTHFLCTTLHALCFSVVSWSAALIVPYVSLIILILLHVLSAIILFCRVPCEHPDNPFDDDVRAKARGKCLLIEAALCIASITLFLFGQAGIAVLVTFSGLSACATMLVSNKKTPEQVEYS